MTMLILWVAYSAIAILFDAYLCQDPDYAGGSDPIPAPARAGIAFLWPLVLFSLCVSAKERHEIEEAIRKRKAAETRFKQDREEAAVYMRQMLDEQLDKDIAEVLDLIEYQKYRVDPWITLQSQPRGSEQCR